jgi:hypothetical protein
VPAASPATPAPPATIGVLAFFAADPIVPVTVVIGLFELLRERPFELLRDRAFVLLRDRD